MIVDRVGHRKVTGRSNVMQIRRSQIWVIPRKTR